ncbi:MAG: YqgE/AlgH family protein [Gemmatales bacterium]
MKSLKGHLLLASTTLEDPNFSKSVVLIFDHTEEGAAGIILNRPSPITIAHISAKVFELKSEWDKPLNMGGPVNGPLAAAHTIKELADLEVMPGVYGAMAPDHLKQLVRKQQEPTLFILNYAGWGPGQLESELEEDSWVVMPATSEHVFWTEEKPLWESCMAQQQNKETLQRALGIRIQPIDPAMN